MAEAASIDNPILNSPYEPPAAYFELGPSGPTGEFREGRRPSESFVPIPTGRRRGSRDGPTRDEAEQQDIDFDVTGERRKQNTLINDIRRRVELWRGRGYLGVTPVTRKLLQHWADPHRENRVLFCQREAAETAIYLAEVSGRHGEPDFLARIDPENREHNDGMPRIALKMATGTGKTVVMAMLITWHTANKAFTPRDARFSNRFLVVTPGITIRHRLRVLLPADDNNYYRERDLVPLDLQHTLADATILITNYHAFLPQVAKEVKGVAANTRKLLTAGKSEDPFVETEDQVVERVLRDLMGRGKGEIVVLNDEAHHCYQDKPLPAGDKTDAEAKERNEGARVWFRGLRTIQRKVGTKAIYDLSATPYYLPGSGYREGFIFPWTVSDFPLIDAIESGIVKIPRVPVDDDVKEADFASYLRLWDHVGEELPKRGGRKAASDADWIIPPVLQGALESLYDSYERRFRRWEQELEPVGEPPPVMIVVCPNTVVSKLVYDWISGQAVESEAGDDVLRSGELPLLSNVGDGGQWTDRPRTILVDSAQLESGEAMKADFKKAAAHEIEVFKAEYRQRYPGADVDRLNDEDLLREVMNTVGKRGRLGEHVRCVVSVAMLTEGWDANTVTHILGIRRFGSQLLCEQVVGRGLRRRSYVPGPDGRFEPEYAEVYGVPFAFMPSDRPIKDPPPARPGQEVRALHERIDLRITFPKVEAYRVEMPDEALHFDSEHTSPLHVDRAMLAKWTETAGLVGSSDEQELDELRAARPQQVAFEVAAEVLKRKMVAHAGATRPWLFPALVEVTRQWLDEKVTFAPDTPLGSLLVAQHKAQAAEAVFNAVVRQEGNRPEVLLPILRPRDGEGSTDAVNFITRKAAIDTKKSHVSRVVLDGVKGNTWEEIIALRCELDDRVAAYVKNDHLDFSIPYTFQGRSHQYVPDFLVCLVQQDPGDVVRTLVIEVSGGQKSPGPTSAKAATARDQWCTAVNNHGGFGRWGYVEIDTMENAQARLDAAIDALYADQPIIGDPVA